MFLGVAREHGFAGDVGKITTERQVTISIFTLSGKRVRVAKMMKGPGSYIWLWDGKDAEEELVLPGLYVYQVVLGSDLRGIKSGLVGVAY